MNDQFTGVVYNIINSMNLMMSTIYDVQDAVSSNVDTSTFDAIQSEIAQTSAILDELNQQMQQPIETPSTLLVSAPKTTLQQVPVSWESSNVDVYLGTGIERFQQEIQSTNTLMERLNKTQSDIARQAYDTDLFSNEAVSDLNQLSARITVLRNNIQQIENNPLNFGTDIANQQLEQLRSQLNNALQQQDNLNVAMKNMDVSAVNTAYSQLSQTVASTERYIRDNTDEQGRFNQSLQDGTMQANTLLDTIKGAVTTYLGIQTAKSALNASDEITQTTARLNLMNDGVQSTQDLLNMVYLSAEDARGSLSGMADVVARFGNNAKDAFSSSAEVIDFANLVQKQMTIAGASTNEASNAMLQLSQGLGSGVLRGDELNSIFEQAPNLIQNIADYLDKPIGQIREMAKEGELTADVVKAAIFDASDEINENFENMPMTWAQAWQSIQNTTIMAFQPVLQRINDLANSSGFQAFSTAVINDMAVVANVVLNIFELVGSVAGFVAENWSIIEPFIMGAATAMGIYLSVLAAYNTVRAVTNALETIAAVRTSVHSAALMMESDATFTATAKQYGFNAALLACPLTWVIVLIIAVIAIIYAVVAAINKATNSTISATGVICGAITTAGAFIWNTAIGLINAIIQNTWSMFVEPFIGIIEWVLNACNGGFQDFGGAVANLIGQIISWFLSLGKVVTKIIDSIFGTDWTSGLSSLQDSVIAWGKTDEAITISREAPEINSHIDYGTAWDTGYSFGEKVDETVQNFNVSDLFGSTNIPSPDDYAYALDNSALGSNVSSAADSADKTAKSLECTSEDLKYLRDIAEREIINRFTTAEIKVEMTNNNSINNELDLDGVTEHLRTKLEEEMNAVAEGVH